MITDQKQTGVPNRGAFSTPTRQRTQLVKPHQVPNIGRSVNIDSRGGPAGTFRNAAPQFNPLRPANAAAQVVQRPQVQRQTAPSPSPVQRQTAPSPSPVQAAPVQRPTPVQPAPVQRQTPAEPVSAQAPAAEPSLPLTQTNTPATPQVPVSTISYEADARSAISKMSRAEISSLLDAIATGTLRGID